MTALVLGQKAGSRSERLLTNRDAMASRGSARSRRAGAEQLPQVGQTGARRTVDQTVQLTDDLAGFQTSMLVGRRAQPLHERAPRRGSAVHSSTAPRPATAEARPAHRRLRIDEADLQHPRRPASVSTGMTSPVYPKLGSPSYDRPLVCDPVGQLREARAKEARSGSRGACAAKPGGTWYGSFMSSCGVPERRPRTRHRQERRR